MPINRGLCYIFWLSELLCVRKIWGVINYPTMRRLRCPIMSDILSRFVSEWGFFCKNYCAISCRNLLHFASVLLARNGSQQVFIDNSALRSSMAILARLVGFLVMANLLFPLTSRLFCAKLHHLIQPTTKPVLLDLQIHSVLLEFR